MRYLLPLTLTAALATAALGAATQVMSQTTSYDVRKVLIVSDRMQSRRHIYLMDSNGLHLVQLTGGAGNEAAPSFTEDGRVLFASDRTGTWQVYRMNLDGTGLEQLTSGAANNFSPAPAHDGSVIFVSDRTNGVTQIFRLRKGASEPDQLTLSDQGESNTMPTVTDDNRVVFTGRRDGKQRLWQMSIEGKDVRPFPITMRGWVDAAAIMPSTVVDPLDIGVAPTPLAGMATPYAPPQDHLVFTLQDGDTTSIYRMWFNGDDVRKLTDNPGYNGYPVVLRDGRILFTSDRDGSTNVWIMTPDGKRQAELTKQLGHYNATK
ncbi:MAG: PD40 domain-containing protein [Chloroflexi bacterium]|nr:PD40 domain-containing protein [Chloroflexota bacterium]